jgi:hypothetical protein
MRRFARSRASLARSRQPRICTDSRAARANSNRGRHYRFACWRHQLAHHSPATRNPVAMRHFGACDGETRLEPGTPGFSAAGRKRSSRSEMPATARLRSRCRDHDDHRKLRPFAADSGTDVRFGAYWRGEQRGSGSSLAGCLTTSRRAASRTMSPSSCPTGSANARVPDGRTSSPRSATTSRLLATGRPVLRTGRSTARGRRVRASW